MAVVPVTGGQALSSPAFFTFYLRSVEELERLTKLLKSSSENKIQTIASILEMVDLLVQRLNSSSIEGQELSKDEKETAESLIIYIQQVWNEIDFSLARRACSHLLRLDSVQFQPQIVEAFKSLFQVSTLSYDIDNSQLAEVLEIEKLIRGRMTNQLQLEPHEFLFFLADLYLNVLERVWLLSNIFPPANDIDPLYQQMKEQVLLSALPLVERLSTINTRNNQFQWTLSCLRHLVSRFFSIPQNCVEKIRKLKMGLLSPNITSLLGEICQELGDNRRAITLFLRDLHSLPELQLNIQRRMDFNNFRQVLPQVQMLQKMQCEIWIKLGYAYYHLGAFRKTLEVCQKGLELAQELKDLVLQELANRNMAIAYENLENYPKAREFNLYARKNAREMNNWQIEIGANIRLGQVYHLLRDHTQALEHLQAGLMKIQEVRKRNSLTPRDLECVEELENILKFHQMGVLGSQGNIEQACKLQTEVLRFAQDRQAPLMAAGAYTALGNAYQRIGDPRNALENYLKALAFAEKEKDQRDQSILHSNIGTAYMALGEREKAETAFAQACDSKEEGGKENKNNESREKGLIPILDASEIPTEHRSHLFTSYTNLGLFLMRQGKPSEALKAFENSHRLALLISLACEGLACGNLGVCYGDLKQYDKACDYLKRDLEIARELQDRAGEAKSLHNLACIYQSQGQHKESEVHFRSSIDIYSQLQQELGNNHQWTISLFEEQAITFLNLENLLLEQAKVDPITSEVLDSAKVEKALAIADARRARSLYKLIRRRQALPDPKTIELVSCEQIKKIAIESKTVIIVYSLCFIHSEERDKLMVYLVLPTGEIKGFKLPLNKLKDTLKSEEKFKSRFPFKFVKEDLPLLTAVGLDEMEKYYPTKGGEDIIIKALKNSRSYFKQRLQDWYEILIKPFENYLRANKNSSLCMIADGMLSQVPFAILRSDTGKYLIEDYSISIAPSISVLKALNSDKNMTLVPGCIVSNPATPDLDKKLNLSEANATRLAEFLQCSPETIFKQEKATVQAVKPKLENAESIHFSCHGDIEVHPHPLHHSVFEGILKLAPDEQHSSGYLSAEEIASFSLKAKLVFLDACYSGTGKVKREGSIGPTWAFHAAGCSSIIASYWLVPESPLMINMINTFYQKLVIDKASKAEALQQALLVGKNALPDEPDQWGCFFLSGHL